MTVNLDGTESVVFAPSCNKYGRAVSTDIDAETEQNPLNPCAGASLDEEIAERGLDGTALWMSTNYGWSLGVRFSLVMNHFVFRGLTDRPLTVCGDGSNWLPFIHVRDAARAYLDAALERET